MIPNDKNVHALVISLPFIDLTRKISWPIFASTIFALSNIRTLTSRFIIGTSKHFALHYQQWLLVIQQISKYLKNTYLNLLKLQLGILHAMKLVPCSYPAKRWYCRFHQKIRLLLLLKLVRKSWYWTSLKSDTR